jgi:putative redox protein
MPTTTVKWVSGKTFVGTDSHNQSVVLSGDDPAVGVSPSEMLLVALAACSAYDVVAILEKKRKKLTTLEVTTTGERDAAPPFPYRTIHVSYRLSGEGLTEAAVRQAIDLSQDKYCSVAATVRGVANLSTDFEIL